MNSFHHHQISKSLTQRSFQTYLKSYDPIEFQEEEEKARDEDCQNLLRMQSSLVGSTFKDFTSDYEQIKERSNEIKQYFLQRFSKIQPPRSQSSCKELTIKNLHPRPLKKNQSHQVTRNLSKSKSLISELRSSSMLGITKNQKKKGSMKQLSCLDKVAEKRIRKGVSENERWEGSKRENIKIKSMEFQTLSQVMKASDSSQLSVNKNYFKQKSSELNFANKQLMTDRIKLLKEQQYSVKGSPSKNILVLKKDQIYKPSTFSLKAQNICEERDRSRMKNIQNYSLQKAISTIEQVNRKYSEPLHLEDEENVNVNEEYHTQIIKNLHPSRTFVKEAVPLDNYKTTNTLQQSQLVNVTHSHINQSQQSANNLPIVSNSMGPKFPNYLPDKSVNRESSNSDSSKYKRRAISEDKIMNSRFIHRKKELDSNEFENYYLNLIKQAHSDSKGDVNQLKKVFLQNSIQRRVSLGIVRLVQESINKRKSRGTSSISLNFNASSQNDHPFDIIHTPERIGENFTDLKSDYCIDYLPSSNTDSNNKTWSSLRGFLDESKVKISDYKDFILKDTERNSLTKSNRSKNQSSNMIDLVRQELKYPSPSKQKRQSLHKKDQSSYLQKLSQQLNNPESSFSSSQTKEEVKEEKPKFLSQEEYQNIARQKFLAPRAMVQGGKQSCIQQEKPLQVFKEEIVQRPDLKRREEGGKKEEVKMQGQKPKIGQTSAFSAFKKQ